MSSRPVRTVGLKQGKDREKKEEREKEKARGKKEKRNEGRRMAAEEFTNSCYTKCRKTPRTR